MGGYSGEPGGGVKDDYLVLSNREKPQKTEMILINKSEWEAKKEAKAFRDANPDLKVRLVNKQEWIKGSRDMAREFFGETG